MHHEFAAFPRARDQRAGAASILAGKGIRPRGRLIDPRAQLRGQILYIGGWEDGIDNYRALDGLRSGDIFAGTCRWQMLEFHIFLFHSQSPGLRLRSALN